MTTSTENRPKSPAEAVQYVAKYLRTKATWEDVINKITDKRISDAERKAKTLSPDNKQFKVAKKLGGIGFFVVIFGLIILSVMAQTGVDVPFNLDLIELLLEALEYIFYGGVTYFLIVMSAEVFYSFRRSGLPELSQLNQLLSHDNNLGFLITLLMLSILLFSMFFFFDFGRLVLAFALIFLLLTTLVFSSAIISIDLLYLGSFKQSNLIFSCRAGQRLWPLRALTYLETGLVDNLSILSIKSSHNYLNTREMEQALKKAVALATRVIVDGSLSAETLKKFLEILQDADCLERVYVRMDDADNHSVELKTIMESFEKDCIFSTETELLELIDPASS